jgi:hypothetical protein
MMTTERQPRSTKSNSGTEPEVKDEANKVVTLAELDEANIERAKSDRCLAYTTYPELFDPVFLRPCTVNILMVIDSIGSFCDGDFALREVIDVLKVSPGPWVRFAVTTAHRKKDECADKQDFVFTAESLSGFHEVWLFGIERTYNPLSPQELIALSQFMDRGGGVFATGDHESLGLALCGRVPRVRSMRKWHFPNAGPNGEPVAPVGNLDQPALENRFDTLLEGIDAGFQENDQSDVTPQVIAPRMYTWRPAGLPLAVYPHPLLCGPRGVLKFLPDHAHEGECYKTDDLTRSLNFDCCTIDEYRPLPSWTRLAPELISWATVI